VEGRDVKTTTLATEKMVATHLAVITLNNTDEGKQIVTQITYFAWGWVPCDL
jgi:hypothetical protein